VLLTTKAGKSGIVESSPDSLGSVSVAAAPNGILRGWEIENRCYSFPFSAHLLCLIGMSTLSLLMDTVQWTDEIVFNSFG